MSSLTTKQQLFVITMEECGELTQACSKVLRHGLEAKQDLLIEEMGDVLFSVSNLSRKLDLDPESVLKEGISKFEKRFRYMEMRLRAKNRKIDNLTLEEFDELWEEAKIFETN